MGCQTLPVVTAPTGSTQWPPQKEREKRGSLQLYGGVRKAAGMPKRKVISGDEFVCEIKRAGSRGDVGWRKRGLPRETRKRRRL